VIRLMQAMQGGGGTILERFSLVFLTSELLRCMGG
jgi:hypothetical protein